MLLLPYLGLGPLARAEIYFLDAARGMVESGDWIVPRYEGKPFFDKPILSYWLMAVAMNAFGTTPAAARLVPVLAALGLVLVTAWLGTLLFDRRSALAGALVLATTLAFLSFARVAMSDMLLALLSTLAVSLAVFAYRPGAPGFVVPLLGAVAGLGFATKGPIAVLIPGIAVLLLLWENRRRSVPGGVLGIAAGTLGFAVIGFGWFVLVYQQARRGAARLLLLRENLQRFAADTYDIGRPVWFYVPAYLAEGLPWSAFLPIALARLLRSADPQTSRVARFLALWPLLVLVPLSLSRGQDRLLPAAALPRGLAARRSLPGRDAVGTLRPRLGPGGPARAGGGARLPPGAAAAGAGRVAARRDRSGRARRGAGGRGTRARRRRLASVPRARARGSSRARRRSPGCASSCCFLPAFSASQPNGEIVKDVARERRYRPDLRMAYCSDPTRVRRDVLLEVRLAAIAECDLWSLAGSREPFLLLATPAEDASFRVDPRYRHIATYRYLSAEALTFGGLFSLSEPGEVMLGANYATRDPEAAVKKKREYRKMLDRERGLAP